MPPRDSTPHDRHPRSSCYSTDWVLGLDMGPHPLWQLEDLLAGIEPTAGSRVLDLGCGKGATSVFLAREYGVEVVAFDLWIGEAELRRTMQDCAVSQHVRPVQGDVRDLPFPDDHFDAIISIDAFEYFGTDVHLLPGVARVLRRGGTLAMSTPALRTDPYATPPSRQVLDAVGWEAAAWHAPEWWVAHWRLSGLLDNVTARMQHRGREDWLWWSRASGEDEGSPVATMLRDDDDQIGFALVSATKR